MELYHENPTLGMLNNSISKTLSNKSWQEAVWGSHPDLYSCSSSGGISEKANALPKTGPEKRKTIKELRPELGN